MMRNERHPIKTRDSIKRHTGRINPCATLRRVETFHPKQNN
jgi:hypothetical protein